MFKSKSLLQKILRPSSWTSVRHHPYPKPFFEFLRNQPQTQISKLNNGCTIATETRDTVNVCIAYFIKAGSRYEETFENGMAHVFEHLAFKGTKARAKELLKEQMTLTGAKYGCYTNREMLVFYAECLAPDVQLVLDILSDCVLNNALAPNEIDRQKSIIKTEMAEHDQDSNAVMYDYLHATAYQGTHLEQTVMGTSANLEKVTNQTLSTYLQKMIDPGKMVLVAVGGIDHQEFQDMASTYLDKLQSAKRDPKVLYRYTGSEIRYRDDSLPYANVVLAVEAPSFTESDDLVLQVASALIGGWDRTMIGGEHIAYYVARAGSCTGSCEAYKQVHIRYQDTGLWGTQFLTTRLKAEDILYMVQSEWMKCCSMVGTGEVERAKHEVKAKILRNTESARGACHELGKWVLYAGYKPALHERLCCVDEITPIKLKEVCSQYIFNKCPVVVAMGPSEALPEYNRIRSGMYWLRV